MLETEKRFMLASGILNPGERTIDSLNNDGETMLRNPLALLSEIVVNALVLSRLDDRVTSSEAMIQGGR